MAFAFERLVFQRAVDFAGQVSDLTEQFPARYNHLADQVNLASLSIASNIAEGHGRFTKPNRKHFFGIARRSVQECVPQLELARRRKLVADEHHAKLTQQLLVYQKSVDFADARRLNTAKIDCDTIAAWTMSPKYSRK